MIECKDEIFIWYLVGLITSDGSLSIDGRHVDITSKNKDFLELVKRKLLISNKVGEKHGGKRQESYRIQISDRNFYKFLMSIGLFPGKSLILEQVEVPHEYFNCFLRGIIDGDGDIRRWIHPTNKREQWALRITSGSKLFLQWLRKGINENLRVDGKIHLQKTQGRSLFKLKFGKIAAKIILSKCYFDSNVLGLYLRRKYLLAADCINSESKWSKSKTVFDSI